MKKMVSLILLAFIWICGYAQTIDPALRQEMEQRGDDEKINVVVIMKSQYDRQQLGRRAANYVKRSERREFVVNELKQFAEASQYDLKRSLNEMERNDMTTTPKIIWMANALYFSATKQAIDDLAQRSDIQIIGFDEKRYVLFDEEPRPAPMTREITSNVTQVNADQVWNLGYTGQGVVVAVIDSGVNYNHLDLADHLWDGGDAYPNHGYDFYNDDNNPMDDHGHGTHCAGTVCGDGTAGQQTGMAPDATLMCVKVLDSQGYSTAAITCSGMQWAVEQGCDLFSMSLGWSYPTLAERILFRNTCAAILDAGVVGAIAAGNNGEVAWLYIPYDVCTPGSCPPPYMDSIQAGNSGGLSCSICVGAVDVNDEAAYFSSQGPVTWVDTEFGDYPYTEGSSTEFGLIRPDVCAPGVEIVSAYYGNNSDYTIMSGTSMATPCVAGCISLLLSKDINATPAEICQLLEETAVSLEEGKSNTFGFGRVDVLSAINASLTGPLTLESFAVNDGSGNNDGKLNAGESVTLDFTLMNDSDDALDGVTLVLSTASDYVTITNGTVTLPYFDAGQFQTIENIFAFTLSDEAPGNKAILLFADAFLDGEFIERIKCRVMVYGHVLKIDEVIVLNDDDGDGAMEPGETSDLHVVISNIGNEPAMSIVGTLSTAFPYLTINEATATFGDIECGGLAFADFNVTLSDEAPELYGIEFLLDLVDANGQHNDLDFRLDERIIVFADPVVKSICVAHWDTNGDGELSRSEASNVITLGDYFRNNWDITMFDELQYFIGLSSINNYAFEECYSLASIVFPESVTSIGTAAFCDCGLTSLTIGNSVTSIGSNAFSWCMGLTGSLTIPNSVTSIDDYAFSYCVGLTSLSIGNSVSYIGSNAFQSCRGLEQIVVESGNTMFDSRENCNALIETSTNTLIVGCKNTIIPNTVTIIGSLAFNDCDELTSIDIPNSVTEIRFMAFESCTGLTSIVIPNSVTSIGDRAFFNCSNLTGELTIPNSVTTIGDYAFYWCEDLTNIVISNSLTEIVAGTFCSCFGLTSMVIPNSVTTIGDFAFSYCGQLTDLTFGNSVTSIGDRAFYYCTGLTDLTLGSSVTSIGQNAFSDCSGLTSLTVSSSVTSIGNMAFYNCDNMNAVYYTGDISQWCSILFGDSYGSNYSNPLYCAHNLFIDNELVTDLVIPESVTEIKPNAFIGATCLTSLTIPDSMVSIGNCAFRGCTGLTGSLIIPNSVASIGAYAFSGCGGLNGSLTIGSSVNYIGSGAFAGCSGFTGSLTIPNSVTEIDGSAFYRCSGFSGSLTIPNSVTYIGQEAFYECSGFSESLTISNSVTEIRYMTFYNCSGFSGKLTIGSSVSAIDDNAFLGCSGLTSIVLYPETPPTICSNVFYDVPKTIPVWVPCGSAEAYQSAAYWSEFTSIQEVCSQQTVTLSQGWNWVSLSIEADPAMTLQMLEEALGNHAEQIKARNGQYAEYDDEEEEWFGNLAGLTCESMYMIHVANDYTIALEGTPVSSTYHEITIAPGWNWIGFPCTTEMSVADAFVDFEAEEDDELKGRGSFTTFEGEGWFGGLTTLQPGQGYMYYSNSTETKTLVFPTSAK